MKITYKITKNDNNKKLKDILKQNMYVSSILLKDLRESKSIYVNNEHKYNSYNVKEGDIVTIDLSTCNTHEELKEAFKKYTIFGRVKPNQKSEKENFRWK